MTDTQPHPPQSLRDVVANRLELHWPTFAQQHPHLAAAIERVRLVDSVARRLTDDPLYQQAMEAAGHDERLLAATACLTELIDTGVRRALGL